MTILACVATLGIGGAATALAAPVSPATGGAVSTVGTVGAVGTVGTAGIGAVVPDSQPPFNVCNNTGPNNSAIVCFSANIEFLSRTTFTLSDIKLTDKACDARSAFATVTWQNGYNANGFIDGLPWTYENQNGCNTTVDISSHTFSASGGVQYVKMALFAANDNGSSTVTSSNQRNNPWY